MITEKLERKPQPDRYCPTCMGYGVIEMRNVNYGKQVTFSGVVASRDCTTCKGSGWVYGEDK